jgi:hypothetical protein
MEIVAVVPALSDDFTVEPVFARPALGRPLEWTGVLPARLEARVDRSLPRGLSLRAIVEGAEVPR